MYRKEWHWVCDVIEFDPDKDVINRGKHELMLGLGAEIFDRQYVEEEDSRVDYGETRFAATGPVASLDDRICVVIYTCRESVRRLISFRKANEKEIRKYRDSHPGIARRTS